MPLDKFAPLLFLVETTFFTLFGGKKKIQGKQKIHFWHAFEFIFFGAVFDNKIAKF